MSLHRWLLRRGVKVSDEAYRWSKKLAVIAAGVAALIYLHGLWNGYEVAQPIKKSEERTQAKIEASRAELALQIAHVAAKGDSTNTKLEAALSGVDLLVQIALDGGVYSKRDIDRFRLQAEGEHVQLRREFTDSLRAVHAEIRAAQLWRARR